MNTINSIQLQGILEEKYPELYDYCKTLYYDNLSVYFGIVDAFMKFIEYPHDNMYTEPDDVMNYVKRNYLYISLKLL